MKVEFTLQSTKGLHAQLASKIVQLTAEYDASIKMVYDNQVVDAKSLLGLLSLAVPFGENLQVIAEGNDAEQALKRLQKLLG